MTLLRRMADLLLDTCAAIWILADAPLRDQAREAINDLPGKGAKACVSPMTAWEVGMLVARGRVAIPFSPLEWFDTLAALPGVALAPLDAAVLTASHALPGIPPRDPADRIIIATARALRVPIVTRDQLILAYADEGHVMAMPC